MIPHLKHKARWIAVGATLTAILLMGIVFFAFAAAGETSDYTGIALVIAAVGGILSTLLSAFATWKASSAKDQSVETHNAVNSRMDEFKRLFEKTFKMEGAEEERAKTAATGAPAIGSAVLEVAEAKARELLAAATLEAARLLAEARQVSINNASENPVPVQLVGPGVDSAVLTKDAEKGKK